jgi:hypothetical protein
MCCRPLSNEREMYTDVSETRMRIAYFMNQATGLVSDSRLFLKRKARAEIAREILTR